MHPQWCTSISPIATLTTTVGVPASLPLPQFTCTQEVSSTSFRLRENQLSVESVGAPMPLLELQLMLSKSQPLFYTSCQRATHEYVCQRGRSHNLCKVSSCIMQLIYAFTGCVRTQECTRAHTHTHAVHNCIVMRRKTNIENRRCFTSHTQSPLRPTTGAASSSSYTSHHFFLGGKSFSQHVFFIGFMISVERSKVGFKLNERSHAHQWSVTKLGLLHSTAGCYFRNGFISSPDTNSCTRSLPSLSPSVILRVFLGR